MTRSLLGLGCCAILVQGAVAQVYEKLVSFTDRIANAPPVRLNEGFNPSSLVEGQDGFFYGTTEQGRDGAHGYIFRMSRQGELTKLVEFTGEAGNRPGSNGLLKFAGFDGNLYGISEDGGAEGRGSVFKVSSTGVFKTLVEFTSASGEEDQPGLYPTFLMQAQDGTIYGVTEGGDVNDPHGTLFRITSSGVYTLLASFTGGEGDYPGSGPLKLVQGTDGIYGITRTGGSVDRGVVFMVDASDDHTTLVEFTEDGERPGATPAELLAGSDGHIYGVTTAGGTNDEGVAFRLLNGSEWNLLGNLADLPVGDLQTAIVGLAEDAAGRLFCCGSYEDHGGSIFEISKGGSGLTLIAEVKETFDVDNDQSMEEHGRLTYFLAAPDGNFYVSATLENSPVDSTVFGAIFRIGEVNGTINVTTLKVLHGELNELEDGSDPSTLIYSSDGMIYGINGAGGEGEVNDFYGGSGTIFTIDPRSEDGFSNLVSFGIPTAPALPSSPHAGVIQACDGYFYGTSSRGGTFGLGTFFKCAPTGELEFVKSFSGNNRPVGDPGPLDGIFPQTEVLEASPGRLIGLTGAMVSGGNIENRAEHRATAFSSDFSGNVEVMNHQLFDPRYPEDPDVPIEPMVSGSFTRAADGNFYAPFFGEKAPNTIANLVGMDSSGIATVTLVPVGSGTEVANIFGTLVASQSQPVKLFGVVSYSDLHEEGAVFSTSPDPGSTTEILKSFDDSGGDVASSTSEWQNFGFRPQGGFFTRSFVIEPGAAGSNFSVGLSSGAADGFEDLICSVVLDTNNNFLVRSGGGFFDTGISYTPGHEYNVALNVDVFHQTYSVEIDGDEIATDCAFGQAVATLSHLAMRSVSGLHHVRQIDFLCEGAQPEGGLLRASDGYFYGTTVRGGANDCGTLFRISEQTSTFEKLIDFSASDAPYPGRGPYATLTEHGDYLYGTTSAGGADDLGTVFRVTKAGPHQIQHQVLFDFSGDPVDSRPLGRLTTGSDGNLYGTTAGAEDEGQGGIFRLVFAGAPAIYPLESIALGADQVRVRAKINARGATTGAVVRYRKEGGTLLPDKILSTAISGYRTVEAGVTLANLTRGARYFYRIVATSSSGMVESAEMSFIVPDSPIATIGPVGTVTQNTAVLTAGVNPGFADTEVVFEYGTDGVNFPSRVIPEASPINGSATQTVTATATGLTPGLTYHVRVKASNPVGTVTHGTATFTTLVQPVATLGSMEALSTTRARLEGTVNGRGSAVTEIRFEWGLRDVDIDSLNRPLFPSGVSAIPGSLPGGGSGPVTVSANTSPGSLVQGTAYHCRLRATGPGGTGESETGYFTLSLLSGLGQSFPIPLDAPDGRLTVHTSPPGTGAWRLSGELYWRDPGSTITGLASGDRTIEFRPVAGLLQPADHTVTVLSGWDAVDISGELGEYLAEGGAAITRGSLQVNLEPLAVRQGANPARWRFLGEGSSEWRASGAIRSELVPGNYLIECEAFPGRVAPSAPVTVTPATPGSGIQQATFIYPPSATLNGSGQTPVDYATVTGDDSLPFGYVGQLRSAAGQASGFAVKHKVVATAAHVVWDDERKAAFSDLQWLFQRDAGNHEPMPLEPRGYFIEDSYSAAREEPGVTPGEGTPRSQHYDYAALFFTEDLVARGGFSGFLASEGGVNEFLTGSAPKILAGYSTDIANPADRGRLHATPWTPVLSFTLEQVPGTIDGESYGTYRTAAIHGRAGSSGGPLFVQHQEKWYPAAIYLGGSGQTVVRAIDRRVVEIFGLAETRGNGGGNSHDGGRILSVSAGGTSDRGSLKVTLLPANLPGARWKLNDSTIENLTGYQRDRILPGNYTITILPVAGYLPPGNQTVTIAKRELASFSYTYRTSHQQWRYDHFGNFDSSGVAADDADPDGDGRTNLEEYAAGTHPGQPGDFLRIIGHVRDAGGFSVTVAGKQGRTYVLESSGGMLAGEWDSHQTMGPLSSDQPNLILTAPPSSALQRFYRVRVEAP